MMAENQDDTSRAYRYWAFITYSHRDAQWCDWLHKAIETYRVPAHLVGQVNGGIEVPRRLFPVFRDREELSTASDLGERIEAALTESRNLIVICSPNSVASKWVNQEIRFFQSLGRGHRVFCLIVDGEPHATDQPDSGLRECFPDAVRLEVGDDGQPTGRPADPLAADVRPHKDGRRGALLKLLAGILNVGFDVFRQRESERRFRLLAVASVVLLSSVVVLAFLSWSALTERNRAISSQSDLLLSKATFQIENDESHLAAASLAQAVRLNDDNVRAKARLVTLLTQRKFPLQLSHEQFHQDKVWMMRLAHDKRLLLTASHDGTVVLHDLATGKQLGDTLKHGAIVWSAEFSADDDHVITGTEDGVARIWRVRDTHVVAEMRHRLTSERGNAILQATFSNDKALAVTASRDGWAIVWDIRAALGQGAAAGAPDERYVLDHPQEVFSVQITGDRRFVLTAAGDGKARLWNIEPGKAAADERRVFDHGGSIVKAVMSPDETVVVTAGQDGDIRLWERATGAEIQPGFSVKGMPRVLSFSEDGRLLVCGSSGGDAVTWDVAGRRMLGIRAQHRGVVGSAEFVDADHTMLTASWDGSARLWSGSRKFPLLEPMRHSSAVFSAVKLQGEERILTGVDEGFVNVWEYGRDMFNYASADLAVSIKQLAHGPDGRQVVLLDKTGSAIGFRDVKQGRASRIELPHESTVVLAAYSDKLDGFVTVTAGGVVRIWDAGRLQERARFSVDGYVTRAALAPDSGLLRLESSGRSVRMWDLERQMPVTVSMRHRERLANTAMDAGGAFLASATLSGELRMWDARTGLPYPAVYRYSGVNNGLVFSPDGDRLLVLIGNVVKVLAFDGHWQELATIEHPDTVWTAQYSPDGSKIVTGSFDGVARVWSTLDYTAPELLMRHGNIVVASAFSDDGRWILTGSYDGYARVWNARSGVQVSEPIDHRGEVIQTEFLGNGVAVFSASVNGVVMVTETGLVTHEEFPSWLPDLAELVAGVRLNGDTETNVEGLRRDRLQASLRALEPMKDRGKWDAWRYRVVRQNMSSN